MKMQYEISTEARCSPHRRSVLSSWKRLFTVEVRLSPTAFRLGFVVRKNVTDTGYFPRPSGFFPICIFPAALHVLNLSRAGTSGFT